MDQVFIDNIESFIKTKISSSEMLGGGDSGFSYQLKAEDGKSYFFKYLTTETAIDNIKSEAKALKVLAASKTCAIPSIITIVEHQKQAGLLLEWIERKIPSETELENFGRDIALLHKVSNENFGWNEDNFISILEQKNTKRASWQEFYMHERIEPLIKKAIDYKIFNSDIGKSLAYLEKRLIDEIPIEKPALIHGDLWSGNFIISRESKSYLIDPSSYFGHREMDLAMSLLFGSFSRPFYMAYQNEFPLEKGFESRLELHQLYPLLVHAILFKGHYIQKVKDILKS